MIETGQHVGALASAGESIAPRYHGDLVIAGRVRLRKGGVHEVLGDSADMFAIIVASRLSGHVVWIGPAHDVESLAPTALQAFLDPARIILTVGTTRNEVLWAGEQALRAPGSCCVVMELRDGPDLTASRRLQIAAEETGALGLALISGRAHTSASQTRWVCSAVETPAGGWHWRCIKHRQGDLGEWHVNWSGGEDGKPWKTGTLHLVAAPSP